MYVCKAGEEEKNVRERGEPPNDAIFILNQAMKYKTIKLFFYL
jgi:hypothetical protein